MPFQYTHRVKRTAVYRDKSLLVYRALQLESQEGERHHLNGYQQEDELRFFSRGLNDVPIADDGEERCAAEEGVCQRWLLSVIIIFIRRYSAQSRTQF